MDQVPQQPQRRRIAVAARLRPPHNSELEHQATWTVDAPGRTFREARSGDAWAFDHAFGADVDNASVFEACCTDVIRAFCSGVNCTIVTYGQTASGKTHTMHGPEGVVPRSVEEVFSIISQSGECRQFLLTVSFVEIYNEQVFDLLAGGEVNTMESQNGLVLQNLTHIAVSCPEDVLDAVALGERRRRVGETSANKRSSRSHVLLRLGLESRVDGESNVRYSQLNLGDLAGSEGLRNMELMSREQRREGSCINKSLLALSQVVQALSESGSRGQRVGFRDSKLTRILQPSLGGNAHTIIICTLSPCFSSRAESRSTLDFATRARCVENKISVNIRKDGHQDSQIRALEKQLRILRDQICSREDTTNEAKELSEENANLRRKIERLEAAMLSGSAMPALPPAATVASNASGKRRRRTIACGAEKEHVSLSETTVRDLMLHLPEIPKMDSVLGESNCRGSEVSCMHSGDTTPRDRTVCFHVPFAPRNSDVTSSICSADETPGSKLRQCLACPRLGVMTPVATPLSSGLRQPGFLSHRPLGRCSTPPKRVDVEPSTLCFSPISLLSIDAESPCRRGEFGSISHIEANYSCDCLEDLQEEAAGQLLLSQDCEKIFNGNGCENASIGEYAVAHMERELQDRDLPQSSCRQNHADERGEHLLCSHNLQCRSTPCESIDLAVRFLQRYRGKVVLDLVFAHWRIVSADSKARKAKERQDEMILRLGRCSCGERLILDARERPRRRTSACDIDDRSPGSPALFPAGAGALGTLLKTQHEGHT